MLLAFKHSNACFYASTHWQPFWLHRKLSSLPTNAITGYGYGYNHSPARLRLPLSAFRQRQPRPNHSALQLHTHTAPRYTTPNTGRRRCRLVSDAPSPSDSPPYYITSPLISSFFSIRTAPRRDSQQANQRLQPLSNPPFWCLLRRARAAQPPDRSEAEENQYPAAFATPTHPTPPTVTMAQKRLMQELAPLQKEKWLHIDV